jgi:hypothetical protein
MLGTAPAPVRRRVRTQPLDVLPPVSADLLVQLLPAELAAEVNKTVVATIAVVNRSPFVDRVMLRVEGLAEWADIQPATLSLRPGERVEAQLTISPPRMLTSRAGRHTFEVVARSEKSPDLRFTVTGALTIKPYSDYQLDVLDPRAITGWHGGRYLVQIANRGNQPQSFTLEGRNDEGACAFRFRPVPITVQPGERRTSTLHVAIRAARLLGQPTTYPCTITAMPSDQSAPPQMAEVRFVQRPPVALWLLKALAILLALLVLVGLAAAVWRWAPVAIAALLPPQTPVATVIATSTPQPTATAEPAPTFVLAGTAVPQVTTIVVTREVQLPAPPPQVIVPTVLVQITPQPAPPAPPPVVTVVVPAATPVPQGPDQTITFAQVAGVPISVRQPIRGDEYAGQDAVFCVYRQSQQGLQGVANQSPAASNGFTLAVAEQPDPVAAGQNVVYAITVENSVAERSVHAVTLAAHLRPGLACVAASTPACAAQPDGSIVCNLGDLGEQRSAQVSITARAGQAGSTGVDLGLTALVREPDSAADSTITLVAAANTAVLEAQTLPNCGLQGAAFIQGRPEFATLTQVMPVIEPPPAGELALPVHVLTSDDSAGQQFDDTVLVVTFQRVVVEARIGVWFPGPAGNYYVVDALDEQGRLIGSFRTDRLAAPAQYQLAVQGVERPIKQLVVQNLSGDESSGELRSRGGAYLTGLSYNYTDRP